MKFIAITPFLLTMLGSVAHGKSNDDALLRGSAEKLPRELRELLALNEMGQQCLRDDAVCTANDVRVAQIKASSVNGEGLPNPDDVFECAAGEELNVTIGEIQLVAGPVRYDIGLLINENGNDAKLNAAECTEIVFSPEGDELLELDEDGCGDLQVSKNLTFSDPATAPKTKIICNAPEGGFGGTVLAGYCVTWKQNGQNDDCDPIGVDPGTKSKCRCEDVAFNIKTAPCLLPTNCMLPDETFPCLSDIPDPVTDIEEIAGPLPEVTCNPTFSVKDIKTKDGTGCPNDTTEITRTYTIVDTLGNSTVCEQIFTISNDIAPVFVTPNFPPGPDDITCTSLGTEPPLPDAEDTCGEPATVTPDCCFSTDKLPMLYLNRTWTATDICGNISPTIAQENPITDTCN